MKRLLLFVLILFLPMVCTFAQDLITTKEGKDIQAKILEVNTTEIKYKRFNNLDGPTFTMPISDILIVRYENGENEVFKDRAVKKTSTTGSHETVLPGMTYHELNKIYDTKYYIPSIGDPYSRGWTGVASFFIPGLGECINGEWGIGLTTFLIDLGLSAAAYYGYMSGIDYLSLGATAGMLAVDIYSICNAVHIAKVKNMYYQDLRAQSSALDIKIEPFLTYSPVQTYGHLQPAAGLSLRVNF